jgi:hypothetical protein
MKLRRSFDDGSAFFHRQATAIIGQRMNDDDRVLARLDNLVQIADRTGTDGARQRTVVPDRLFALE